MQKPLSNSNLRGTLEGLIEEQPRVQSLRSNLAKALRLKASIEDDAENDYTRAAELNGELLRANPDVIEYRVEAGQLHLERGLYLVSRKKHADAVLAFAECEDTLKNLALRKADAAEFVATCLLHRGKTEIALDRKADAVESLKRSLGWWNALLKQTKDDPFLHENLAEVNRLLSGAWRNQVNPQPKWRNSKALQSQAVV